MEKKLREIVDDYIEVVVRTLELLEDNFGKVNYILAKGSEEIPKRGFLDKENKIPYNLHGVGITVDYEDVSIVFDFDFHSNNHLGFNAWQLERFTKINSQKYSEPSELDYGRLEAEFQNALNDLERQNKIEFDQSKNRYYPT